LTQAERCRILYCHTAQSEFGSLWILDCSILHPRHDSRVVVSTCPGAGTCRQAASRSGSAETLECGGDVIPALVATQGTWCNRGYWHVHCKPAAALDLRRIYPRQGVAARGKRRRCSARGTRGPSSWQAPLVSSVVEVRCGRAALPVHSKTARNP